MVLVYSGGGIQEHNLVKVAKLQCVQTADHCPCLFWWGHSGTQSG